MSTILTPQLVEQARALRANHVGWHTVSKRTGVSEYLLRVELEPHFQEHRREQGRRYVLEKKATAIKRAKARERGRLLAKRRAPPQHVVTALDRIPDDVMREAEQRKIALERRTLTESFFGDPPQGWRALDQRAKG
jgi:hypothetical protein